MRLRTTMVHLSLIVSRTRCGILHAAPQSRDRTKHRRSLRPRLCSAPLRKCYALHCVRGTFRSRLLLDRPRLARYRGDHLDRFLDRFDGAFGRARAVRDQIVGAVEIEPADLADAGRDQEIWRIAGKPRPGNAILHDVESIDHHRGDAWPPSCAKKLALDG